MMKFSQRSLTYKVLQNIRKNNFINKNDEVIVACSGGADSIALLDILCDLESTLGIKLSVCHFNHKMRGEESEQDEKFVLKFCRERGLDCLVGRAEKVIKNEEGARKARYEYFDKIFKSRRGAKVALAHHANDTAETVIFHLIRGTGLSGLIGIPASRGRFFRPLLPFSREEIIAYLEEKNQPFCVDKTNSDLSLARNYIRHNIMPIIKKLNPRAEKTIYESITSLGEDDQYLEAESQKYFTQVKLSQSECRIVISRKGWLLLHPAMQSRVLRIAIEKLIGLDNIGRIHLDEVRTIIEKGAGKKHTILPRSLRIELESGRIIVSKLI